MKKAKSVNFTAIERTLFLDILKKYKNVIENKKSDAMTLKDKDAAWTEISNEFNSSRLVCQERTSQQLKKLWTNIKHSQRDAITKEKQGRMATGGGPEIPSSAIDPDVALIVPNLMTTAPTIFSSNLVNTEMIERQEIIVNCLAESEPPNTSTFFENILKDNTHNPVQDNSPPQGPSAEQLDVTEMEKDEMIVCEESTDKVEVMRTLKTPNKKSVTKRPKNYTTSESSSNLEAELKIERIKQLMAVELEIQNVKLRHEEKMSSLREQHVKIIHELEVRLATATAEIAERKLELLGAEKRSRLE